MGTINDYLHKINQFEKKEIQQTYKVLKNYSVKPNLISIVSYRIWK